MLFPQIEVDPARNKAAESGVHDVDGDIFGVGARHADMADSQHRLRGSGLSTITIRRAGLPVSRGRARHRIPTRAMLRNISRPAGAAPMP